MAALKLAAPVNILRLGHLGQRAADARDLVSRTGKREKTERGPGRHGFLHAAFAHIRDFEARPIIAA